MLKFVNKQGEVLMEMNTETGSVKAFTESLKAVETGKDAPEETEEPTETE